MGAQLQSLTMYLQWNTGVAMEGSSGVFHVFFV